MSEILDRRNVPDGEVIFAEGDEGRNAFLIQNGNVSIYKTVDGDEKCVATFGPTEIFGEMGLIDLKPRTATARSNGGCTIITITHQMFEAKLAKSDPFIRHLLNIMAETIRKS